MKIAICDKCKKELKYAEGYLLKLGDKSNPSGFFTSYDLCDKCTKKFKKWVESAE